MGEAERSGFIRPGDYVIAVDGCGVADAEELRAQLERGSGTKVDGSLSDSTKEQRTVDESDNSIRVRFRRHCRCEQELWRALRRLSRTAVMWRNSEWEVVRTQVRGTAGGGGGAALGPWLRRLAGEE